MNNGKADQPKPDRHWVLNEFKRRQLTQKDVAALIDVDPVTLSSTLNGHRKLNLIELKKLSDVLQIPVTEIMAKWGMPLKLETTVPLCWYAVDSGGLIPATEPHLMIPSPPGLAMDSYAVEVRSADSPNSIWNRTICFVPEGIFEPADWIGHLVIAHTIAGQLLFGELSRGLERDLYTLTHPASKAQHTDMQLERVRPISWTKHG
jgi:transcriptional regulator with XRE-family HTH domain